MAGAVRELPPVAAVVEQGSCDLRLSSTYFALDAGYDGENPFVFCHLRIYVHRFAQDGRRLSLEIIPLDPCVWEASRLLSPQGAAEDQAVHASVVQAMECKGLQDRELDWVGRTLLGYAQDVAAWALRPGAAPLMSEVFAAIHVRLTAEEEDEEEEAEEEEEDDDDDEDDDYEEEEEDDDDDYGEGLPSSSSEEEADTKAEDDCGEAQPSEECCAICLKRMAGRKGRRWLSCAHSFHGGCIGIWLRRKLQCPLCRSQVTGPAS
ncbi:hypothetical protein Taro_028173 [Colocasia esculenta]|uniref:RING-type E3 ubiquitin transferase n=1 Tax=Colocasia esculenta TaxID=4460 RepID=A0A843VKB8_COLES|nr:hypothetical protein [Colocasia esculenta]